MAHEAGKGDNRRPEDKKAFDEGYDRIFGKKRSNEAITAVAEFYKVTEQEVKELYMDEVTAWESLQKKGVV